METSNGGLYFKAGMNLTQLSEDARSAKEILKSISTEAIRNGQALDNAFAGDALKGLSEKIGKASASIKELSFDTVEEKVASLSIIIKDSEQAILSHNENIKKWKAEAQKAFNSGDYETFNKLTEQISEAGSQMQEMIDQTHVYADALNAIKDIEGLHGADDTLRLYDSEEDLKQVKALEEEIQQLQLDIRSAMNDGADTSELQAQLQSATAKMNKMKTAAAETAASLGNDLASRAVEAQQTLAALNEAIDKQQSVIKELEDKVKVAADALEILKSSGTATRQEIDAATASLEFYQGALQGARNELSLLQGAQVDAKTQWNSVSNEVETHNSVMVKMLGGYDNYKTALSNLPAPLQSVIGGISGMTKAAKAFIATPLGAVIAALVMGLQALFTWFNSSKDGQLAFAKVSGYVSGVLGQLKDVVIAVGKAIYNAFSNPKEAIKNLWESIKTNILNRVKGIANMFKSLGQVISSALDLDWDGVKANLKTLSDDFLQVTTGVENLSDKVMKWGANVHEAAKATSDIAVASKELELQAAEWQKRSAELDQQKAQAMAKIYDTSLSAAARKEALKEYKKALQEQTDTELQFQERRIAMQKKSMALTASTIEDEKKLAELEAQKARIMANQEQQLASLTRRQNSVNNAQQTSGRTADSEAAKKAIAQMNMTDFERKAAQDQRELALSLEQARIDAMTEGFDKTLAQNRLNWEKLRDDNVKRAETYVKEYRDKLFQDYLNENPNATKGEQANYKLFLETEVNADDLPDTLKSILKQYEDMANEFLTKANKDSLEAMLQDVLTYEQQRTKMQEEFKSKRDSLYEKDASGKKVLREGVTQGNVDELDRQAEEALGKIDEQFAQREETYKAWCEQIANMSLEKLEEKLDEAKKKLKELASSGTASDQDLAVARAKVRKAQDAVNTANAKAKTSPDKRSINEWEDLYKTLSEVEREFESIGDTVGGVVGDIISECGQFATATLTMINGIVTLTQMSSTSIKGTAAAGATAISTMEKSSVILTIISAALQIAMQIVNLFNNDDKKQKEIDSLQKRIDQLQWELDNPEIGKVQAQYGTAISRLNTALIQSRAEIAAGTAAWGKLNSASQKASRNTELMQKTAGKLAKEYANMSYSADKAFGAEKYSKANDQLKNLAEQQILLQEQINAEASKKKTDKNAIEEMEKQIEEKGKQALEIINGMVEDIIGDTAEGLAEQLGDAFIDAFQAGEDAAEAWGDKVNDIVADVLKRMLISKCLEEPLGEIFDKYKSKWFKDGEFQGLDAVVNSMEGFAADLNAVGDDFADIWEKLPESVKGMFKITDDAMRDASQKGIATASQESVDELNGRATAIQGHTFSIAENTKTLLSVTQSILNSVMRIESETEGFRDRLARMDNNLKEANDTLGDIVTKGIKLKN